MNKRFAIFDLDGTLLNTLDDLCDSINHILKVHGFPQHSIDDVRRFVGNGIRKLCERAVPAEYASDEKFIDELYAEMSDWYNEHCKIKTAPYPGVIEAVKKLNENGYSCAIVSNKIDSAVKELADFYFKGLFVTAIGEKPSIKHKPAPDMVFEAMKEMGADKEKSVYIGDSEVDHATAVNSGLPCVSVLWGFRDRDFLIENGADTFAKDTEGMTGILLDMFSE